MNAELLEKALWAASTARNRSGSEQDAVAAVLRVAIEACAEIAKSRAIQERRQEKGQPDIAEEIAEEIESLLN